MNIPLIIIIVYMVLLIGVSIFANKLASVKGDSSSFLLAGNSLPTILVAAMVAGTAIGGTGTIGIAESAYTKGLSAVWYNIAWTIGILAFAFLMCTKLRRTGVSTTSQIFIRLFNRFDGMVSSIIQVAVAFGINALQAIAGGAILTALLPQYFNMTIGVLVSAVVFTAISLFGGYMGATLTNVVNVVMIYLGVIVGFIGALEGYGGWESITVSLPQGDQWFSMVQGIGPVIIIGWVVSMVVQSPPNQGLIQATAAGQSEKAAKRGMIIAALLIIPIGFLCAFIGIIAAAKLPNLQSASLALPALMSGINPWVAGLTLAGLWAADVSTATSCMMGLANVATKDIIVRKIRPNMDDRTQLLVSKAIILIFGLLGAVAALNIRSILGFMMQLIVVYTPYCFILLSALYCPKLLRKSTCTVSVVTNLVIMVLWTLVPTTHIVPDMIYLCLPATFITMGLCMAFDKRLVDMGPLFNNSPSKTETTSELEGIASEEMNI